MNTAYSALLENIFIGRYTGWLWRKKIKVHASHFSSLVVKDDIVYCAFIQPILCLLLMTVSGWKLNIGHLMWQSSKVWFMLQRANWQHFLRLQAAPLTFLTYLKTLGDIYLALNCAGCSQIIYLCLELPLNKEQTCCCGCISLRKYRFT